LGFFSEIVGEEVFGDSLDDGCSAELPNTRQFVGLPTCAVGTLWELHRTWKLEVLGTP